MFNLRNLFKRKQPAAAPIAYRAPLKRPEGEGWCLWMVKYPPVGVLLELRRLGDNYSVLSKAEDICPECSVGGLYWRLTGIAKEALEAEHGVSQD